MDAIFSNFGILAQGFWGTIKLSFVVGCLSLIFGTILAAMRVSPTPVLQKAAAVYVNVVRNTPLTLVFFFSAFGLPYLGIAFGRSTDLQSFWYAVIAMTAYTSCFICEAIRGGISTIPVGQAEAARSIGMSSGQNLKYVVMPQALRTVVGPLGSQLIAMVKNTSIASAFNYLELIAAMNKTIELRGDEVLMILIGCACAYLFLNLILGQIFALVERKVAIAR